MPDWAHAVLYMFIWLAVIIFFMDLMDNLQGAIIGIVVGQITATLIVSRLPGFWGGSN